MLRFGLTPDDSFLFMNWNTLSTQYSPFLETSQALEEMAMRLPNIGLPMLMNVDAYRPGLSPHQVLLNEKSAREGFR